MNKHLYITDLDGTLLNSKGSLSTASRELMITLLRHDAAITVATARHITSVQPIFKGVPLSLPAITGGGAYISSIEHGTHDYVNGMSSQTAWSVFDLISSHDIYPYISSYNGNDNLSYFNQVSNAGMEWYLTHRREMNDKRLRLIRDPGEALNETVVSIFVIGRLPEMELLCAELEEACGPLISMHILENLYSRDWYWLIVHDRKARKNWGAQMVMNQLGYEKSEVTVFGDDVNDIDLFQAAGRRVAVANAAEELKQQADVVIGSNEEDSVPRYILEDLGLN